MKNKLATLQDRLDNPLKDDYTALRQLEKTLSLSETANKKLKNKDMKAYLEFSSIDEEIEILNKTCFGAKITNACVIRNEFVAVYIDWDSKIDNFKFKYAKQGSIINHNYNKISVDLQFESYPYRINSNDYDSYPTIRVNLTFKSNKKMDYVCFHNLKYGAVVYFAPQDWNTSKHPKKIDF